MKKLLLLLGVSTLLAASAQAALVNVGPFAGVYSENWETFIPTPPGTLNTPQSIMGGFATLNPTPSEYYGSTINMPPIGGVALLQLVNSQTPGQIVFSAPVQQFGAYWAGPLPTGISVSFFDSNGGLIGGAQNFNTVFRQSLWQGWSSDVGIASMTFSSTETQLNFFAVMDNLQAVAVPEASTWIAGGLLLGAVTFRTLREIRARKLAMIRVKR